MAMVCFCWIVPYIAELQRPSVEAVQIVFGVNTAACVLVDRIRMKTGQAADASRCLLGWQYTTESSAAAAVAAVG